MPPPKKPKNGPITMEQFISQEDLHDNAQPRERGESCSDESNTSGLSRRPSVCSNDDTDTNYNNQGLTDDKSPGLKLLRDLILKKQEATKDRNNYFVKEEGAESINRSDSKNSESNFQTIAEECDKAELDPLDTSVKKDEEMGRCSGSPVLLSGEEKLSLSQTIQESISKNEKILNSIVVSTLMPTVPRPSGIHSMSGYLSPYLYSHSMPVGPYLSNEPRDLSTKLHTNGSLSENVYGRDPLSSYGIGQYGQVSPERKELLDSRKNLVGILTESRYGQNSVGLRIPSSMHDRDTFSFYLNGFDTAR